ncbi:hypothetical protein QYM36_010823 [Artemia franciscana]|uniref:Ferritin n=2 Tax=Artemia franciscana TaxID=6661 RepID=A0AA88HYG5_ARTSF|nr:hypothetical protein QYM36_010823 [Artemia franciscana]
MLCYTRVPIMCCPLISSLAQIRTEQYQRKMSIKMQGSRSRQNYHPENEGMVNKQINMEFHAYYVYRSMALFFNRDDVALPGFSKYFKEEAEGEKTHADKFIEYQSQRGGRVACKPIDKPQRDEWDSPLHAMEHSLELEKQVYQSLLDVHASAELHKDHHLTAFLEDYFLRHQVEALDLVARHITKIKRVGDGLGIYMFDKELQVENKELQMENKKWQLFPADVQGSFSESKINKT